MGESKDGDDIKDFGKALSLFAVGLVAAIGVYPFLHEMGHIVASVITGAKVFDVQLWPIPSTLCEVNCSNRIEVICIGFGGNILPFGVTILSPPKRFITWYLWAVIKCISIISFALSLWSVVFFRTEFEIATDDMTYVMQFAPDYKMMYLFIITVLLAITMLQLVRSNLVKRCMAYFDV